MSKVDETAMMDFLSVPQNRHSVSLSIWLHNATKELSSTDVTYLLANYLTKYVKAIVREDEEAVDIAIDELTRIMRAAAHDTAPPGLQVVANPQDSDDDEDLLN